MTRQNTGVNSLLGTVDARPMESFYDGIPTVQDSSEYKFETKIKDKYYADIMEIIERLGY